MRRSLRALAVAVVAWPLTASAGGTTSASVAPASSGAASAPVPIAAAAGTTPAIVAADALLHVRALTAPEMEGRGALTPGLDRAAAYIAARLRAMRLAGAGDGGTYFEAVDLPLSRRAGPGTALRIGGRALALGRDFAPNLGAAAARAQAGVVFAGYGISIAGGYDDYAAIDARGQMVICLRYAPHYDVAAGRAADPAFSAGATLRAKIENAIRHGAVAIAIVDPPVPAAPAATTDAAPLPVGAPGATNIASFHLARTAADQLLGAEGVAALQRRIDDSGRPVSLALPLAADLAVEWQTPSIAARNVVAVLLGSDPALRQEAVLIGAHYDHLGRGDEGNAFGAAGQIHPGADDNASGTAAMLEVAEAMAAERAAPKRSILFVAFTGEERGLIGSLALAEQAGRRHVVAMLNLDMVGRMRAGAVEVGASSTALEWEAIASAANDEKLALTFPKRVAPNSDHAPFLNKEIPSLFLFTGLHGDYHRASDTWDKIDADGIARAARLARRILVAVANRDQRLAFVAPQWLRMGAVGGTHGITVRLGVMPDYQSENGLRVSAVMAGGAGAEAGLKAGDIIDRIGENSVGDIESYMEAMALFKAGDETVIQVRRDGASQTLKVTFGAASVATDPAGSKP